MSVLKALLLLCYSKVELFEHVLNMFEPEEGSAYTLVLMPTVFLFSTHQLPFSFLFMMSSFTIESWKD